jgi:lipopolysaccharide/colanic/teichoic acid biosynthesis glycosyltransferase
MKRLFDFFASLIGLILISPILLVIGLIIVIGSKGPVFYIQKRIGKHAVPFNLYKFRSMKVGSDKKGLLTLGDNDVRVTKIGYFIRKYKIDELPQLINVLKGDMSLVGPRPEVSKYVELYNNFQKQILSVKPGITDRASIKYRDEAEMLTKQEDPETFYIKQIMPDKVEINIEYIKNANFFSDINVIFSTVFKILK